MILRTDFLAAMALATGVHLAAFALIPVPGGGGSGNGGSAQLSLSAASPAIAAEVAKWETVPEAAFDTPHLEDVPQDSARPDLRRISDTQPGQEAPMLARATGDAPPPSRAALDQPPLPLPEASPEPITAPEPAQHVARATIPTPPVLPDPALAPEPPAPPPGLAPLAAVRPTLRPTAPEPSEAVARRTASGSGGGISAGASRSAAATGLSAADEARAQARWAAQIQARIARKQSYPRGTRATGRVKVQMTVLASGALGKVGLVSSSGEAALDRAALLAVERAAPFPPAPKELKDDWFAVSQWITFERR